jgi:lactoylglutathione lyase
MPQITKLTPNLIVSNVERSIGFYRDTLGFSVETTVPDQPPFVFAVVHCGAVEIFLNAAEAAGEESPAFNDRQIGGTLTLYLEVTDVVAWYDALKARVSVLQPLEKKWYGVTEFAISDPDGWVITFAERAT